MKPNKELAESESSKLNQSDAEQEDVESSGHESEDEYNFTPVKGNDSDEHTKSLFDQLEEGADSYTDIYQAIKDGANLYAKNSDGDCPIHVAVKNYFSNTGALDDILRSFSDSKKRLEYIRTENDDGKSIVEMLLFEMSNEFAEEIELKDLFSYLLPDEQKELLITSIRSGYKKKMEHLEENSESSDVEEESESGDIKSDDKKSEDHKDEDEHQISLESDDAIKENLLEIGLSWYRSDFAKDIIDGDYVEVTPQRVLEKLMEDSILSLKDNPAKEYSLANRNISDDNLHLILDALAGNETLRSLDLSNNRLTETGLNNLLEFIKSNTLINRVNLSSNKLPVTYETSFNQQISNKERLERYMEGVVTGTYPLNFKKASLHLDNEANVNALYDGWSLLNYAVRDCDFKEVINFIKSYQPNLNSINSEGESLVYYLIKDKKYDELERLFSELPNIRKLLFDNEEKKGSSITRNIADKKIVEQILSSELDKGFDLLRSIEFSSDSYTKFCLDKGKFKAATFLIELGTFIEKDQIEEIEDEEDKKIINEALEKRFKQQEELRSLVSNGNLKAVRSFLKQGFRIEFSSVFAKDLLNIAIKNKHYELCAFLISQDKKGEINNDELFVSVPAKEKEEIKAKISILQHKYLDIPSEATIDHLMSKISFKGLSVEEQEGFRKKFKEFLLENVCQNELLKSVIEPLKFDQKLKIVFDLSRTNVSGSDIVSETAAGTTRFKDSEIYIAGGKDEIRDVFGTTIHEFCHHACYLLWHNKANPYKAGNEAKIKEFDEIIKQVKELYDNEAARSSLPQAINLLFENYKNPNDWAAELIVRVPQAIVCESQKWEKTRSDFEPIRKLLTFYEANFVAKSKEFIESKLEQETDTKISALERKISRYKATLSSLEQKRENKEINEEQFDKSVAELKESGFWDRPQAAIKIQSVYRGHRIAREYAVFKEEELKSAESTKVVSDLAKTNPIYQSAAESIQEARNESKNQWRDKILQIDKPPTNSPAK